MTFEQFVDFYHNRGFCVNDVSKIKRKNSLSLTQLQSKYTKYVHSLEKVKVRRNKLRDKSKLLERTKQLKVDFSWDNVCEVVTKRDKGKCRLIECLDYDEYQELKKNAGPLKNIIDHAHVIRRTQSLKLKYDSDNIVLLNRFSHSMLDQYRNPLNGKPISKEETVLWWTRIIGLKEYEVLLIKKKEKKDE